MHTYISEMNNSDDIWDRDSIYSYFYTFVVYLHQQSIIWNYSWSHCKYVL